MSYYTGIKAEFERNENENFHAENRLLMVETFGSPQTIAMAQRVQQAQEEAGQFVDSKESRQIEKVSNEFYKLLVELVALESANNYPDLRRAVFEALPKAKPDPYAMKLPKIKKGQKFILNGEEYTFLRFNQTRMNQKGGRPVVAVKTGSTEFSNLSLLAFRDAKPIEEEPEPTVEPDPLPTDEIPDFTYNRKGYLEAFNFGISLGIAAYGKGISTAWHDPFARAAMRKYPKVGDKVYKEIASGWFRGWSTAHNEAAPVEIEPEPTVEPEAEEFNNWFRGSKIVNEDGSPKVLYHGTASDFEEFEIGRTGAIFLTDNIETAKRFSTGDLKREGDSPRVIPLYVSLKKPFDTANPPEEIKDELTQLLMPPWATKKQAEEIAKEDDKRWKNREFSHIFGLNNGFVVEKVRDFLISKGFDGYIDRESGKSTTDPVRAYAVFDSKNIRRADGVEIEEPPVEPTVEPEDEGEEEPTIAQYTADLFNSFEVILMTDGIGTSEDAALFYCPIKVDGVKTIDVPAGMQKKINKGVRVATVYHVKTGTNDTLAHLTLLKERGAKLLLTGVQPRDAASFAADMASRYPRLQSEIHRAKNDGDLTEIFRTVELLGKIQNNEMRTLDLAAELGVPIYIREDYSRNLSLFIQE